MKLDGLMPPVPESMGPLTPMHEQWASQTALVHMDFVTLKISSVCQSSVMLSSQLSYMRILFLNLSLDVSVLPPSHLKVLLWYHDQWGWSQCFKLLITFWIRLWLIYSKKKISNFISLIFFQVLSYCLFMFSEVFTVCCLNLTLLCVGFFVFSEITSFRSVISCVFLL